MDARGDGRAMSNGKAIIDDFAGPLDARWHCLRQGGGTLTVADSVLWLALPDGARRGHYSNAQIDDYGRLPIARYPWRPPLRLEVRARASHPAHPARKGEDGASGEAAQRHLRGTAGFGFWNAPLTIASGMPRLPEAVWFFAASPPSNMALVPGSVGWGWKAQVVHAQRWGALAASVPTLGAMLAARLTGHEAMAAAWVRRVSGASEVVLDAGQADLGDWHDYVIEWRHDGARFFVDDREALAVPDPPRGPLGFVAWIDNQYAVATPRGAFRFGTLASASQWLALDRLCIIPL